jgi:hypothetical protein
MPISSTTFDSERAKAARGTGPRGAGNKPTRGTVREVRAHKLLNAKLAGMTTKDAGQLVGLSERQSQKELAWMQKAGLLAKYEDQVVGLIPSAVKVAEQALAKSDTKVALKILDILVRLGERAEARSSKDQDRSASLSDYIARLQVKAAYEAAAGAGNSDTAGAEEPPIDAEVLAPDPSPEPDTEPDTACP